MELWNCYPDGYRDVDVIQMQACRTGNGWVTPKRYNQWLPRQDGGVSGSDGGYNSTRGTSIIPAGGHDPFHGAPRGVR